MKLLICLFVILFSSVLIAQVAPEMTAEELAENKKSDFKIDWKYMAGEYLIFDCERNHYACVNVSGFDNCQEERNFAIGKKLAAYPCAPLKKFPNKKSCVLKNYETVDILALKRFCYPAGQR